MGSAALPRPPPPEPANPDSRRGAHGAVTPKGPTSAKSSTSLGFLLRSLHLFSESQTLPHTFLSARNAIHTKTTPALISCEETNCEFNHERCFRASQTPKPSPPYEPEPFPNLSAPNCPSKQNDRLGAATFFSPTLRENTHNLVCTASK